MTKTASLSTVQVQARMIGVASAEMIMGLEMKVVETRIGALDREEVATGVEVAAVDAEPVILRKITRANSLGTTTIGDNNRQHLTIVIGSHVSGLHTTRRHSQSFEIESKHKLGGM